MSHVFSEFGCVLGCGTWKGLALIGDLGTALRDAFRWGQEGGNSFPRGCGCILVPTSQAMLRCLMKKQSHPLATMPLCPNVPVIDSNFEK